MWHAHVAHMATRASSADGLHHRLLGPDALQHRIGTDSLRHLFDAGYALVAALRHDVGCPEVAGELLSRSMPAHSDDPLGSHLLCRQDAEQTDRAIADDGDGRAWLHVRRIGGEPAGAHDIRQRQQAGYELLRWDIRRGD